MVSQVDVTDTYPVVSASVEVCMLHTQADGVAFLYVQHETVVMTAGLECLVQRDYTVHSPCDGVALFVEDGQVIGAACQVTVHTVNCLFCGNGSVQYALQVVGVAVHVDVGRELAASGDVVCTVTTANLQFVDTALGGYDLLIHIVVVGAPDFSCMHGAAFCGAGSVACEQSTLPTSKAVCKVGVHQHVGDFSSGFVTICHSNAEQFLHMLNFGVHFLGGEGTVLHNVLVSTIGSTFIFTGTCALAQVDAFQEVTVVTAEVVTSFQSGKNFCNRVLVVLISGNRSGYLLILGLFCIVSLSNGSHVGGGAVGVHQFYIFSQHRNVCIVLCVFGLNVSQAYVLKSLHELAEAFSVRLNHSGITFCGLVNDATGGVQSGSNILFIQVLEPCGIYKGALIQFPCQFTVLGGIF